MAKKRTPIETEYYKQRRRLQNAIKREQKRGFIVDYSLPAIPKKITKASVRRLAQITPKKIREKSFAINPETGEATSAQGAFIRSRWKTPEKQKKKAEELAIRAKEQERREAEERSEQFFPNMADIVINNYTDMMLSRVLPNDILNELKETLQNPEYGSSVHRKYSVQLKSRKAIQTVLNLIRSLQQNKQGNKVAMNLINNGQVQAVQSAIEKLMYGYSEEEVELGLTEAIAMLTDNGKLTAPQFRDLAQTDDYINGVSND